MPDFSRGTPAGLWRNKVDNRTFNHELIRDVTEVADAVTEQAVSSACDSLRQALAG